MLGPFATASRRTPIHQGVASGTVARRLRIDVHDDNDGQRQRQRVTEGTAMAPWNGPNYCKDHCGAGE